MPITITDDPTTFPAVTAPSDSDVVGTSVMQASAQALANRTAGLKARVDAIAPGTGGSPGLTTKVFHVADIPSMVALSTQPDGSICLVDGYGLFQYRFGDFSNDPPFKWPDGAGPNGSWWLLPVGAVGSASGIPRLDSGARVAAATVRNGVINAGSAVAGTSGTSLLTFTSGTLADILSVTPASVAVGDIFLFRASFGVRAGATGDPEFALTAVDNSVNHDVQTVAYSATEAQEQTYVAALEGSYTATSTSLVLKARARNKTGSVTHRIEGQAVITYLHLRP